MFARVSDGAIGMRCLEKYRGGLIRGINRNLKVALAAPDEVAIHDFRVGIKRVTALYAFLQDAEPAFDADAVLARYRGLFKACGRVRDLQIARGLVLVAASDSTPASEVIATVDARIGEAHAAMVAWAAARSIAAIRLPTVRGSGVSETRILQRRESVLASLLRRVLDSGKAMTTRRWHRKRIRLKRYRHTLDAFQYCPDPDADLAEIARIQQLEQQLGDWHDRVVTSGILQSMSASAPAAAPLAIALADQAELLLDGAQDQLDELRRWYAGRGPLRPVAGIDRHRSV